MQIFGMRLMGKFHSRKKERLAGDKASSRDAI
jgi:hypothetical protein